MVVNVLSAAAQASRVSAAPSLVGVQQRNMATLREIKARLTSVTNIQKITASMKMVSAAKFSRAERQMNGAKAYGKGVQSLVDVNDVGLKDEDEGRLIVALSSDRGLCGGIHSSIAKAVRPMLNSDSSAKIVVYGDKVRSQLRRQYPDRFLLHFAEVGKTQPNFLNACAVAEQIRELGHDYTKSGIVYQNFISAISYEPVTATTFNPDAFTNIEGLDAYEVEDEVRTAYAEFTQAANLYSAMTIAAAAEQSARMQAMENATNNAGDVIDGLTILYNRTRQAVITNELIEIISGASAV